MRTTKPMVLIALAVLFAGRAEAQSLLVNGGLEGLRGWSVPTEAQTVEDGRRGGALRLEEGLCTQDVLVFEPGKPLTCSVWIEVESLEQTQPGGFVFAAVYQYSFRGEVLEFDDFAQLQAPAEWRRHEHTFTPVPAADLISVRLGYFNARGVARFDDASLVPGETAADPADQDAAAESPSVVAILKDGGFPGAGSPADPGYLGELLTDAGIEVQFLNAGELADPAKLSAEQVSLVVLPYGRSFPAEAHRSLVAFLKRGGDMICLGGYPFEEPLVREGERWAPAGESARRAIDQGRRDGNDLIPNPGFEMGRPDTWEATGQQSCSIVRESPRSGEVCARVRLAPSAGGGHDIHRASFTPEPGGRYLLAGSLRTEDIVGDGFAYLAVYQWDEDGELAEFHDVCHTRGTSDWSEHTYRFAAHPSAARVEVQCGIYNASGTAWFDDVIVVPAPREYQINTSDGEPRDGLDVSPAQIGLCDPSYPLKRVARVEAAADQWIMPAELRVDGRLEGFAAVGLTGGDNARWVPLLLTYDRYGRPRGAVGSLLDHAQGFYAGSTWACFSAESRDLFSRGDERPAEGFVRLVEHMLRGVYLRGLRTEFASYSDGETVRATIGVGNTGPAGQPGELVFSLRADGAEGPEELATRSLDLEPGQEATVEVEFDRRDFAGSLCVLRCELRVDDETIDAMQTGFVIRRPELLHGGIPLDFGGNYFRLGDRPTFLTGTDTYGNVFSHVSHHPLTWRRDMQRCLDFGLSVYENLQYTPSAYEYSEAEWRQLDGIIQLAQQNSQAYMAGLIIGGDVDVSGETFERQRRMCASFAERYQDVGGLIYYFNGDLRMSHDPADGSETLWRDFLRAKYGTADALAEAWGPERAAGSIEDVPFPVEASTLWTDVATADLRQFETRQTALWLSGLHRAVRDVDPSGPTTAEFYRQPFGGIDISAGIGELDVSNIGYFDKPGRDIERLPGAVGFADMRARGKSVSLGEFGVKTHAAWSVDNGAVDYHIARTEDEARELWLMLGHYALGLGASKIQNWCLDDSAERVFPWGLFHAHDLVPKDIAATYRNISLLFRQLRPRYVAPEVAVLLPDTHRIGPQEGRIHDALWETFAALADLRIPSTTLTEATLDLVPRELRAIIFPIPYCTSDETFERLMEFVESGGALYVSGDIAYDEARKRTRADRVERLTGLTHRGLLYENIDFAAAELRLSEPPGPLFGLEPYRAAPGIRFEPMDEADPRWGGIALASADAERIPIIVARPLGEGRVFFVNDPVELRTLDARDDLRMVYRAFAYFAGVRPLDVQPLSPDLHAFSLALEDGGQAFVLVNKGPATTTSFYMGPHRLELELAEKGTGLAWLGPKGELRAVEAQGAVRLNDQRIAMLPANAAVVSLDGRHLPESEAVLVLPFGEGVVRLEREQEWQERAIEIGDFEAGEWRPLERVEAYSEPYAAFSLGPDQAVSLALVCEEGQLATWREVLSAALVSPQDVP